MKDIQDDNPLFPAAFRQRPLNLSRDIDHLGGGISLDG
jgi:hypothetical protein